MDIQTEYIVVVNGRPFFSVTCLDNLASVRDEAWRRFGDKAKIEIFKQVTTSFDPFKDEPGAVANDSK